MYGKGFLGNMTENLHADCVQSRQAGFMQCFLFKKNMYFLLHIKKSPHLKGTEISHISVVNLPKVLHTPTARPDILPASTPAT